MTTDFDPQAIARFEYVGVEWDAAHRRVTLRYALVGSGDHAPRHDFAEVVELPEISIGTPPWALLRLLWLAAGLSYYKAAAPPLVTFPDGVTEAERTYLAALIAGGLGEYAYVNDRVDALTPAIEGGGLAAGGDAHMGAPWNPDAPPLVPVGGGKDSVVTIETVRAAHIEPVLFSVGRYRAIDACAAVAGLPLAHATRRIDPALMDLNARGALNGHIPITAINSAIALLVADTAGLGPVLMSNEESANHGNVTWHGRVINHQWSKSLDAERAVRAYLTASGLEEGRYLSLLRPLNELTIARLFALSPQYLDAFTSCNRAFSLNEAKRAVTWCGECPKCEFVYLILAPYVDRARLTEVFGSDLLDRQERIGGYRAILGLEGNKPFECVGGYDEAAAAFSLARAGQWADAVVVEALSAEVPQTPVPDPSRDASGEGGGLWAHLPPRYREAVERRVA